MWKASNAFKKQLKLHVDDKYGQTIKGTLKKCCYIDKYCGYLIKVSFVF